MRNHKLMPRRWFVSLDVVIKIIQISNICVYVYRTFFENLELLLAWAFAMDDSPAATGRLYMNRLNFIKIVTVRIIKLYFNLLNSSCKR